MTPAAPAHAGGAPRREREPGRVLVLALLAWGTGHAALGHRRTAWVLLAAEVVGLLVVAVLHASLSSTTLAVVPFLAGAAFMAAWAAQAIDAYRRARSAEHAIGPTEPRSSAATIAWLGLPLLVWWTGFWIVAGSGASPEAVLDRFLRQAPRIADGDAAAGAGLAVDPGALATDMAATVDALRAACSPDPCDDVASQSLLHGTRMRVTNESDAHATAVLESVHYDRRDTRFLGIFPGAELVPVTDERLLVLRLEPIDAAGLAMNLGAQRWVITDSRSSGAER